ncbi:sensor histidine kinase [Sphingomonas sp. SM33]|uniref:histidine kinase n=1 Tax=Sphingomonas telluris TaxID=2907998 RepID=A0ABS9VJS9_9SPHN|nr:ATP-binding protein [Sphingomonas telluris]MCH8615218.1 sensor histidine kinase [Sphingomonas telluris]
MSKPRSLWFGHWTLAHRILAVNLLTIVLLACGVLYLDAFRNQLSEERLGLIRREANMSAGALAVSPREARPKVLESLARSSDSRIRVFGPDGRLVADSWQTTGPTYELRDPNTQKWTKDAARAMDRGFNILVGATPLDDFIEPEKDSLQAWPEALQAKASKTAVTQARNAPDLTPVFSAATPAADGVVLLTTNDRDFTRTVRSQRRSLFVAMALAVLLSVLLSLFLARTIVRPLRRIALAAHRVRLGRAREVKVPRLPSRTDEIGLLARSISDMSQSLRHRMDNIEHFAADVTHELKNPLASLRSAVEGLERVQDPELRTKLLAVARNDVVRLDRLIGDISEAARTDAELARARFEPVDLGSLIEQIVGAWEHRRETGDARLAFARPRKDTAVILGDPGRLARAIDNIIDNAISFSPSGGLVEIAAARVGEEVRIRIDDEGPGVPEEAREAIFNRFHSVRPESEDFGRHSGLGLAIARAIVEGHDGEIDVQDRDDAPSGARFTIRLPATELA